MCRTANLVSRRPGTVRVHKFGRRWRRPNCIRLGRLAGALFSAVGCVVVRLHGQKAHEVPIANRSGSPGLRDAKRVDRVHAASTAMEAGISDHVWTLEEIAALAD